MGPVSRRTVALVGIAGLLSLAVCAGATETAQANKSDVDLTTRDIGSKETALGDIVADAIRTGAGADVALIDASAFEEAVTVPKGAFAASDVLKALSYKSDSVFTMKLTGDQIRSALDHGLFLYPKFNSAFLQFSGLTVTINPSADADRRVVSVKVDGGALEGSKTYKVAMRAPLANGALAYSRIWKSSEKKDTSKSLEAAITSYLGDHRSVTKGDERLVTKGK